MAWENILRKEIKKFDNVGNMTISEFGRSVIRSLEALGFEIKYDDHYEDLSWMKQSDKRKYRDRVFINRYK